MIIIGLVWVSGLLFLVNTMLGYDQAGNIKMGNIFCYFYVVWFFGGIILMFYVGDKIKNKSNRIDDIDDNIDDFL